MTKSAFTPNAGDSIIVRLKIEGQTQGLSQVTTRIAELKGHIGAIDLVRPLSGGASYGTSVSIPQDRTMARKLLRH